MNQDNLINLIGDLAKQVRLLRMENTETQKAVKQLQREENNTPQTELPHVVPRAPKVDTTLYGIQSTLANITRPIDFYIYKKVQNNPEWSHSEDPDITFTLEMRLLLADVASGITQSRRDLVYRTMELPEKVPKLNEEQDDSLFNSEEFDTVVEANKKARKRPVRSKGPFCQRQQVASGIASTTAQNQQAAPTAPTAPSSQSSPISFSGGMVKKIVLEGFQIQFNQLSETQTTLLCTKFTPALPRKIAPEAHKLFQKEKFNFITTEVAALLSKHAIEESLIHDPKKDWGFKTSTRLEKIKRTCSTTTFQNRIIDIDMQDDIEKRLHDIDRSTRCVSTYSYSREMQEIPEIPMEWENTSVQSASVRSFPQPFSLYQNAAPDNNLGTSIGNKDCVLFGRHHNIAEEPTNMPGEHQYSSVKAQ
ncbi:hypothetical protein BB561_006561 [Smittium simulii]|uniref:Uncharacterized protein n=1 Tax=Smittium simulii TaxID=133385 RepID=A0A2T9Y350_9FUNG|nr:hypothetical protein BB561_006561 [Smittium simulii]